MNEIVVVDVAIAGSITVVSIPSVLESEFGASTWMYSFVFDFEGAAPVATTEASKRMTGVPVYDEDEVMKSDVIVKLPCGSVTCCTN